MPVEKSRPVPPFLQYCATLIPTVFDNSLSYYEALCALTKWLQDNLVNVVNNNAEITQQYITLVDELQKYVENYFENLDVQDEINNKLDEMAEAGTLQEIMASYLDSNVTWTFDTVADMLASDNLVAGSYAKTEGYYTSGDGGGATYRIRSIEVSDVDSPLTHILGSLVAELIIEDNELHSRQYGLKGDGETDETDALNAFFEEDKTINKVMDKGIYYITDTIYIGGLWRQDSGNNGERYFKFNSATFLYGGTENGYAVILYNMFKYRIQGLSIARNSVANKLGIIGLWHNILDNIDVQSVDITSNSSILDGRSLASASNEYINFRDGFIKGQLLVHPVSPAFINCINFYNSLIYSTGFTYCVMMYGATTKQEFNFYNCDISYASSAVFYIDEEQTANGKGSINCVGCYFDSNISIFAGDNKRGMEFNNLFGLLPALSNNEIVNVKYTDFVKNLNLCGFGQFGYNLPLANVNYAINGDLAYQSNQSGNASYLMGTNSTSWTKTYETSNLSINGKARKIQWTGSSENASIIVEALSAPRSDLYTAYARLKITQGTCTGVQISFAGAYTTVPSSKISGEFVALNSKNTNVSANGSLNFSIIFLGASDNLIAEIYEVGVTEGKLYIPNAPVHANAKLS